MSKALVRATPVYQRAADLSAAQVVANSWLLSWRQPQRRAAFYALGKSILVIGALWEYVWLWHTKYYSKHYVEVPLSIAWSLLTVIAGVTFALIGCSAVLKARSTRLRKQHAETSRRLTEMLAEFIAKGDFEDELIRYAHHSTSTFEECITNALLSTRGAAHERICELPAMAILRDRWIDSLHKRDERDRRYAVEHLALLRDPQATMALEYSLDDQSQGVVAAAIRGLLRMPGYTEREHLIRSLPNRPYLVRILTAGESPEEAPKEMEMAMTCGPQREPVAAQDRRETLALRQRELQLRAQAVEEAIKLRRAHTPRVSCSVLAASGAKGRGALGSMAASGDHGDAPAEALGGMLAATARGGR